jgi:transcriptional regulator with XRE-family HTH domain
MITKQLSDNLNILMAKARLNSSELARLTGLPATTIKRIRNNEQANPTVATLLPIAKHFSVTITDLLGGEFAESLPNTYIVRSDVKPIPLFTWRDCVVADAKTNSANKVLTEKQVSKDAFALIVEDRDFEVFPVKSILLVDPAVTPASGDYVIVAKSQQGAASIKKYIVETDQIYLKSLVTGLGIVPLTAEYQILGVVIQYKVELK